MATRKSTTSAKTKTTKKTTKTAAKPARTSKVSTKVTAVKAVSRQSKKVKTTRRNVLSVGNLLGLSVLLYVGLAAAVAFFMQSTSQPLTITHQTRDLLVSESSTVFVSAYRSIVDIDVRWVVVALLALSTVLPILYLTKLKNFYADRLVNSRSVGPRWVDMGLGAILMTELVLLLAGVSNIITLKMVGTVLAIGYALGWLAEKQNEKARRPEWSALTIGLLAQLLPVLAIAATFLATVMYGDVRSPWYVYALGATVATGSILMAVNQYNQHRRFKSWADYTNVERKYLFINVATKTAFAAILIAGLPK